MTDDIPVDKALPLIQKGMDWLSHIWRARESSDSHRFNSEVDVLKRVLKDDIIQEHLLVEQANIAGITLKARDEVGANLSRLDDVPQQWWTQWRDRAKLFNDDDMQLLFARVLAGEMDKQGAFSPVTINVLSEMNKGIATRFRALCSCVYKVGIMSPNDGRSLEECSDESVMAFIARSRIGWYDPRFSPDILILEDESPSFYSEIGLGPLEMRKLVDYRLVGSYGGFPPRRATFNTHILALQIGQGLIRRDNEGGGEIHHQLGFYSLTPFGHELSSIVTPDDKITERFFNYVVNKIPNARTIVPPKSAA